MRLALQQEQENYHLASMEFSRKDQIEITYIVPLKIEVGGILYEMMTLMIIDLRDQVRIADALQRSRKTEVEITEAQAEEIWNTKLLLRESKGG